MVCNLVILEFKFHIQDLVIFYTFKNILILQLILTLMFYDSKFKNQTRFFFWEVWWRSLIINSSVFFLQTTGVQKFAKRTRKSQFYNSLLLCVNFFTFLEILKASSHSTIFDITMRPMREDQKHRRRFAR